MCASARGDAVQCALGSYLLLDASDRVRHAFNQGCASDQFMTNLLKKISWLLLLPLLTLGAIAQPSGNVIFDFDGGFAPIWDLSGPYEIETPAIGAGGQEITVLYTVYMEHTVSGALRGSGVTTMQIGNELVVANYTVSGTVNGSQNVTKANFTVSIRGRVPLAGKERSLNVTTSFKMRVSDWGGLEGSAYGSLKISGVGTAAIRQPDYAFEMPGGVTGSWRLALNYIPFKRFAGTGNVYLSTYFPIGGSPIDAEEFRIFPGNVAGTYSESKDITDGKFTGTGPGRGVEVEFRFGGYNDLLSGSAKMMGQRLRF